MKITDWFDPYNVDHINGYVHYCANGFWPDDCFPKDIEFIEGWEKEIENEMINAWITWMTTLGWGKMK